MLRLQRDRNSMLRRCVSFSIRLTVWPDWVLQARLDALYAKRGRTSQFRNRAERDSWLRAEIDALEGYAVDLYPF